MNFRAWSRRRKKERDSLVLTGEAIGFVARVEAIGDAIAPLRGRRQAETVAAAELIHGRTRGQNGAF